MGHGFSQVLLEFSTIRDRRFLKLIPKGYFLVMSVSKQSSAGRRSQLTVVEAGNTDRKAEKGWKLVLLFQTLEVCVSALHP
jgi:hypothetical protein